MRLPQVHHSQTQWEPDHHAPSRKLKLRQQWIYQNILIRKEASPCTHGFVPERSIVTNAILHIGYAYTYCVDITDFFPSITKKTGPADLPEHGVQRIRRQYPV